MRLLLALIVMLLVNVMLFMFQTSVDSIATAELIASPVIYDLNSNDLSQYQQTSGVYVVKNSNVSDLPTAGGDVSSGTFIFIDWADKLLNWIKDSTGFNYVWGVVDAVPKFLRLMGLPSEIAFVLGVLWHVITVFLIIAFIRGGAF